MRVVFVALAGPEELTAEAAGALRTARHQHLDHPDVFGEHISRPSLADPRTPRRSACVKTMVLL